MNRSLARIFQGSLAAMALMINPTRAESPSDHDWQAHWLTPTTAPALNLDGAQWIWADEPGVDPSSNASAGSRFFVKKLTLAESDVIEQASGLIAADNQFQLKVNGKEAGKGNSWQQPSRVEFSKLLKAGENVIEIEAINDPGTGSVNAAGLIAKLFIKTKDGTQRELMTNGEWQAQRADRSDAAVRVIGALGVGPWVGVQVPGSGVPSNLWTCWRKSFELKSVPKEAPTRIAVDSKYWLWINGKIVVREGSVKRGPNPQDTYFDLIDLAPYLKTGRNQIALLAWYFGKEGFSHKSSGLPGMLFELQAGEQRVISDTTWKELPHPAFGQHPQTPNFRLAESSVMFDARADIADWTAVDFDDQSWRTPQDHGLPPAAPWNRLWQRSIPQWKDFGLKPYVNAKDLPKQGGTQAIVAKLPYNAQFTPWLKIKAPAGLTIRMRTENAASEIFADYITRDGVQEFETPAWMSGHAAVYEIPAGVTIIGLAYRESGFNTEFRGHFECDQEFFNQLWGKCERTLYINMRDTFFDCPDRERAAWWGDIVIQLAQVFRTFDTRSHALVRKCMYNLANWQRPSKTFFSPIPAGNWDKELPQQMLATVSKYGFWTYYLHTGDKKTIADLYPHVRDYLSIWQLDGDGLIVHRSGENGWDWADWGENVDIRMLDQAWYCLALEGAANMAEVLALPEEAKNYRQMREGIIAATNRKFWNGKAYRDTGYNGATDDRAQGMAVVAGIAGPDRYEAIQAELAQSFHASPYIEKYILEALFLMDQPDLALQRMQKRYQEMVDSETSTVWELFSRAGTLNHAWTGGPLELLARYSAGVVPTSPGYDTMMVKPQLGGLKKIVTGFDSVKGRVELKIAAAPNNFHLHLESPAQTSTTVCVPVKEYGLKTVALGGKIVWQNGKYVAGVAGVKAGEAIDGHATFLVPAGQWKFHGR